MTYSLHEVVILTANSHRLQVKEVLPQEETKESKDAAIFDCWVK